MLLLLPLLLLLLLVHREKRWREAVSTYLDAIQATTFYAI